MKIYKIISILVTFIGGFMLGFALIGEINIPLLIVGAVLVIVGLVLAFLDGTVIKHKNVPKNRTKLYIPFDCKKEEIENIVQNNLSKNKYSLIKYGDEDVYKLGNGIWTARKLIKYNIDDSKVVLECWISMGIGNNPNTELELDEKFVGLLPKRQLKSVVDNIIKEIEAKKQITASQLQPQNENK